LSTAIRCCGAAGVMAGVLLALGLQPGYVSSSGVASLALDLALAIPAYFGALLLLGGIRQRDWIQLMNLASRRFD